MNGSLFTTRQLTEYRECPNGRNGCLFYVPKENSIGANAGIYLIGSSIRKEDHKGEYDALHRTEWLELKGTNAILVGSLGELFFHCATTSCNQWDEYKVQYAADYENLTTQERIAKLILICREWIAIDKHTLNLHANLNLVNFVEEVFRYAVITILHTFASSIKDMMWGMTVNLPIKRGSGFSTYFINYLAARSLCKYLPEWCSDNDVLAQSIIDYLTESKIVFPIEKLDFQLTLLEHKKVYNAYLKPIKDDVIERFAPELKTIFQPTQSAFWPCYRQIIDDEIHKYGSEKESLGVLLSKQTEYMQLYVCAFFHHLIRYFDFLEEESEIYYARVNSMFPEDIIKMIPGVEEIYYNPNISVMDRFLPSEGNYNELVKYVSERRRCDPKFAKDLDMKSTLKARCEYLHPIIRWYPDPNSLNHNLTARTKSKRDTANLNVFPTR